MRGTRHVHKDPPGDIKHLEEMKNENVVYWMRDVERSRYRDGR
jgi:hypothetical protein